MVDAERIRSSNVIDLNRNYTHEHTRTHYIYNIIKKVASVQ